MTSGGWSFAAGKAVGTSHASSATPCQDAFKCEVLNDHAGNAVLVAVVADGAGSAPLSHLGATLACDVVVSEIRQRLAIAGVETLERHVVEEIVLTVRSAVAALAVNAGRPLRDYACTLVGAVVGPTATAFFQVGDGVIVVAPRNDEDNFIWVFWPDRGEYANTTAFITDERWTEHLQAELGSGTVNELAVLTDGLQNLVLDMRARCAHSPFFHKMLAPLRGSEDDGEVAPLSEALSRYLDSPRVNERTDDDKTLVLASRRLP